MAIAKTDFLDNTLEIATKAVYFLLTPLLLLNIVFGLLWLKPLEWAAKAIYRFVQK